MPRCWWLVVVLLALVHHGKAQDNFTEHPNTSTTAKPGLIRMFFTMITNYVHGQPESTPANMTLSPPINRTSSKPETEPAIHKLNISPVFAKILAKHNQSGSDGSNRDPKCLPVQVNVSITTDNSKALEDHAFIVFEEMENLTINLASGNNSDLRNETFRMENGQRNRSDSDGSNRNPKCLPVQVNVSTTTDNSRALEDRAFNVFEEIEKMAINLTSGNSSDLRKFNETFSKENGQLKEGSNRGARCGPVAGVSAATDNGTALEDHAFNAFEEIENMTFNLTSGNASHLRTKFNGTLRMENRQRNLSDSDRSNRNPKCLPVQGNVSATDENVSIPNDNSNALLDRVFKLFSEIENGTGTRNATSTNFTGSTNRTRPSSFNNSLGIENEPLLRIGKGLEMEHITNSQNRNNSGVKHNCSNSHVKSSSTKSSNQSHNSTETSPRSLFHKYFGLDADKTSKNSTYRIARYIKHISKKGTHNHHFAQYLDKMKANNWSYVRTARYIMSLNCSRGGRDMEYNDSFFDDAGDLSFEQEVKDIFSSNTSDEEWALWDLNVEETYFETNDTIEIVVRDSQVDILDRESRGIETHPENATLRSRDNETMTEDRSLIPKVGVHVEMSNISISVSKIAASIDLTPRADIKVEKNVLPVNQTTSESDNITSLIITPKWSELEVLLNESNENFFPRWNTEVNGNLTPKWDDLFGRGFNNTTENNLTGHRLIKVAALIAILAEIEISGRNSNLTANATWIENDANVTKLVHSSSGENATKPRNSNLISNATWIENNANLTELVNSSSGENATKPRNSNLTANATWIENNANLTELVHSSSGDNATKPRNSSIAANATWMENDTNLTVMVNSSSGDNATKPRNSNLTSNATWIEKDANLTKLVHSSSGDNATRPRNSNLTANATWMKNDSNLTELVNSSSGENATNPRNSNPAADAIWLEDDANLTEFILSSSADNGTQPRFDHHMVLTLERDDDNSTNNSTASRNVTRERIHYIFSLLNITSNSTDDRYRYNTSMGSSNNALSPKYISAESNYHFRLQEQQGVDISKTNIAPEPSEYNLIEQPPYVWRDPSQRLKIYIPPPLMHHFRNPAFPHQPFPNLKLVCPPTVSQRCFPWLVDSMRKCYVPMDCPRPNQLCCQVGCGIECVVGILVSVPPHFY